MSAGVGGGGILVPIFNIILGLSVKESTGLSQAVIASSGIGVALFSLTNPHPHFPTKPLVDFDLVLVLTPALLLGISFGVLVNAVAPGWFITVSICLVLTYMAQKMLRLAINLRNKERESMTLEALRSSGADAENGSDDDGVARRENISSEKTWARPKLPWTQIAQVIALWIVFAALNLGKSRHGRCTLPYLLFYVLQVFVALAATIYFVQQAIKATTSGTEEEDGVASNTVPLLSSPRGAGERGEQQGGDEIENAQDGASSHTLSKKNLSTAAGITVGAGVLAGLIGMGGGFLLGPLLLSLSVHPQVSSATSALMVLFSSSSAAIAFAVDGRLDLTLAAVFGSVTCVFGFLGCTTLAKVVKKHGASVVVFLLAFVMILGLVATVTFGGRKVWHDISVSGKLPGFQPFCRESSSHDDGGDEGNDILASFFYFR
jgi:uncharacterized membrane protein YfcA